MKYFLPIIILIAVVQLAQTRSLTDLILTTSGNPIEVVLKNIDNNDDDDKDITLLVQTNENNTSLNIQLPEHLALDDNIHIQILDVNGIVLEDKKIQDYTSALDISDLHLGVYYLRLQSPQMLSQQLFNVTASHSIRFQ